MSSQIPENKGRRGNTDPDYANIYGELPVFIGHIILLNRLVVINIFFFLIGAPTHNVISMNIIFVC